MVGAGAGKMGRKTPAVRRQVAVSLGANDVKWVLVRETLDRVLIEQIRYRKLTGSGDEEVSSFLAACFDEFKGLPREAVACLPSSLFISKNVDMPSSDPEEIRKIVNLHAGRYTPYAREEIIIDYMASQSPEQHYTNVLLVIINRVVSNRLLNVFGLAGIFLEKIVIGAEGVSDVCSKWAQKPGENIAFGILNVGADDTDILITDRGSMVFVRNIPIGARQMKEQEGRVLSEFGDEVKQTFMTYQDQGIGRPISRAILTGLMTGDAALEGEVRNVMHHCSSENVQLRIMPYPEHFELSGDAKARMDAEPDVSMLDLFSVLSIRPRLKINLIPDEVKLQRQVREGSKDIITLGVTIMSFLLIFCLFLTAKVYLKNLRKTAIEEMEESTTAEARSLEGASTKVRVLRGLLETRGKGLYVFDKLTAMITDDIYLTAFSYDRDGAVTIGGTADSMSRVYAFVTTLEESLYFKNVETKQTKTRKEGGKEVADFEISCTYADITT
jgi:hypothetical protein